MKTSEKILIEIFLEKNVDWVKCEDIQNEAKDRGLSTPTFYRSLRELTEKGVLEKKRISKKNVQYRLDPSRLPRELSEIFRFKNEALETINKKMMNGIECLEVFRLN